MNEKQVTTRRRWLRFRLSTILLVITIVALADAQYVGMRRVVETQAVNRRLAEENAKLRAEAGYLEVDDPNKVSVLRVRNLDELTWQWKVYLPVGKWRLSHLTQGIPRQGVPDGPSTGPIDGGREVQATVTVRKGADGKWQSRARVDQSHIGNDLKDSHRLIAPLADGAMAHGFGGENVDIAGDKVQESFDRKQPVVLIRLRAHDVVQTGTGWETKEDPKSSDGIMVWLNPVP